MNQSYLGDGAYAMVEGGMIKIYTEREDGEHYIYLEQETWEELKRFAANVWPSP